MTPLARFFFNTFTRHPGANLKERRRKRWSETYSRLLFGIGVLLTFLQQKDVIVLFPSSWHPYIAGASAAFALIWGSEYAERYHDRKRYEDRLRKEAERVKHSPFSPPGA